MGQMSRLGGFFLHQKVQVEMEKTPKSINEHAHLLDTKE
jgi:hypothetical protein